MSSNSVSSAMSNVHSAFLPPLPPVTISPTIIAKGKRRNRSTIFIVVILS